MPIELGITDWRLALLNPIASRQSKSQSSIIKSEIFSLQPTIFNYGVKK